MKRVVAAAALCVVPFFVEAREPTKDEVCEAFKDFAKYAVEVRDSGELRRDVLAAVDAEYKSDPELADVVKASVNFAYDHHGNIVDVAVDAKSACMNLPGLADKIKEGLL